jgi:transcriptional regulator with XRE-family HTH domain
MDVRARVGQYLMRRDKGLSQEALAHAADVHQTYVSDLERGKRNPSILVLDRLAKAIDADMVDLCAPR